MIKSVKVVFRLGSLWIGAHYSPQYRRWCINFIPCITLVITLKDLDQEEKQLIESIRKLPTCAKVSPRGGLSRCSKVKCEHK